MPGPSSGEWAGLPAAVAGEDAGGAAGRGTGERGGVVSPSLRTDRRAGEGSPCGAATRADSRGGLAAGAAASVEGAGCWGDAEAAEGLVTAGI